MNSMSVLLVQKVSSTVSKKKGAARGGLQAAGAWAREVLLVVIAALVASTLLRVFIVQMFGVPTESMENTIEPSDRIAVQKVAGYARGDVVVFRDSLDWLRTPPARTGLVHQALVFVGLAPDDSTGYLVKRLVGLPGDHVVCCDAQSRVTVNGVALNEDYLFTGADGRQDEPSDLAFDVVVPKDHLFFLGDHRSRSQDSRCHLGQAPPDDPQGSLAFVPQSNVVGTVVAVVYPFSRFTGFARPATFDRVPAPTAAAPAAAVIVGERPVC